MPRLITRVRDEEEPVLGFVDVPGRKSPGTIPGSMKGGDERLKSGGWIYICKEINVGYPALEASLQYSFFVVG